MPDPALGAIPHLVRGVDFWLTLVAVVKEVGVLRLCHLLQHLLMLAGSHLDALVEFVLGRMSHLLPFLFEGFRVRRKQALAVMYYRCAGLCRRCIFRAVPGILWKRARKLAGRLTIAPGGRHGQDRHKKKP